MGECKEEELNTTLTKINCWMEQILVMKRSSRSVSLMTEHGSLEDRVHDEPKTGTEMKLSYSVPVSSGSLEDRVRSTDVACDWKSEDVIDPNIVKVSSSELNWKSSRSKKVVAGGKEEKEAMLRESVRELMPLLLESVRIRTFKEQSQ